MLIIDAHEDMAWSMLTFGRDYTRSAAETRRGEAGSPVSKDRDDTMLGWPDYQRGRVALVFATLYATPGRLCAGVWDSQCYADSNQAYHLYNLQIDAYERLVSRHSDKFRLVMDQKDLGELLSMWKEAETRLPLTPPARANPEQNGLSSTAVPSENSEGPENADISPELPVGLVMLMEGAEGVREPSELELWWQRGVRVIGPAWAGTRYCGGTHEPGALTRDGFALLEGMAEFGFALDLSHMDEAAALQALDYYPGRIIASHSNALSLVKGSDSNRHLSDRVIRGILERDGVIGIVLYNAFLKHGWRKGDSREGVTLDDVAAQVDYICQMAGNARQVGIGSDFDGGFGLQSVPADVDTIADLQKLVPLLVQKGYTEQDAAAIMGGNWEVALRGIMPENL